MECSVADSLLGNYNNGSRYFYKKNDGLAIVGLVKGKVSNGTYYGPVLVSKIADAVAYRCTASQNFTYQTTFTYNNETWYISPFTWFVANYPASDFPRLTEITGKTYDGRSNATIIETGKDLLDYYYYILS